MNLKLSQIRVFVPAATKPLFAIPELIVPSGAKILVRGRSGLGKSTLLHLMAGLFAPSEGYVFVVDQNLSFLSEAQRCRLRRQHFGIVFQKLNLLEHLTAYENVRLGLAGHSEDKELAEGALQRVGMASRRDVLARWLSLGEQQRVAVARVVAAGPKIVLADEPTSSLDDANAEAVITELLRSSAEPTVVVVSHDARLQKYFDKIYEFDHWVPQ